MLHNLSLRNIVTSTGFLKSLIWLSVYLKIVSSVPVNGFLGFKGSSTSDFINLSNLWVKGCIFINVLIIFYLDSLKL